MKKRMEEAPVPGWILPVDTPIQALFEWCVREHSVDRLLLSARLDREHEQPTLAKPEIEDLVSSTFSGKILMRQLTNRWPGTELIGHVGMVFEIEIDAELIVAMARLGPRLDDWRTGAEPPLPEDPCLFRVGDEWPVLVSVTHEREAWILSTERPPFCQAPPFDYRPENLLVPPAEGGFVGAEAG